MSAPLTAQVKESLRAEALKLGFAACGFTTAEPLGCGPLLVEWLARERHGSMGYLARAPARRTDPREVLPQARSIVVAAWPYPPAPPARADWRDRLTGRIAAYALGTDYHDVLGERLARLAEAVAGESGRHARVQVDAGPLVEKDLARRAGLGWFGRNTNVLSRARGSYFLIGCILTEVAIEPDEPFEADHCGTCRTCVPACPTGALDDGPTIDARKCISYLTIEHRGPIDPTLRSRMGNWVFGCDVCQDVCPWTPAPAPATELLEPPLPDLLLLGPEEFHARFGGTAVARAKRRGLARNAAIALGNSRNPAAAEPLAAALREHDEPLVRAHAAWALGRIATAPARAALGAAAAREAVPPVRTEIAASLHLLAPAATGAGLLPPETDG
jgi:epoxyqueuosine reductase